VPAFRVKLGANDLNCVDVPLNPTHSLKQRIADYCKTHIFRMHQIFAIFANRIKLQN